jgi:hypothetical protein
MTAVGAGDWSTSVQYCTMPDACIVHTAGLQADMLFLLLASSNWSFSSSDAVLRALPSVECSRAS